jgi:hypothetical protein
LSSNFSVVLKSTQTEKKSEAILCELMTDNIEVLAWIKIPKYNKKYNLSELLKMIGDLSKIWVFE